MNILKYFLLSIIFLFLFSCNSPEQRLFAIAYNPELDITKSSQILQVDDVTLKIDIDRPIKTFKKLNFYVEIIKDNKALDVDNPIVRFNMKMDMGKLVYMLKKQNGIYIASGVLIPKCITGDNRWYAKITFQFQGKSYSRVVIFDVN
jgi:stress response protein SCP2